MNRTQQTAIINATQVYLDAKGASQEELATKIGYSGSVLSQILKGTYPGDAEQVFRKLATEIGFNAGRWQIRNTNNYQSIQNICLDAQESSRMMAAYGETGCGKTSALQKYYQNTQNCYYILANVLMKPKDLILTIQKAVGADDSGTLAERIDSLVSKLLSKNHPLLIIDDCGKLEEHQKCFGIIQLLFDKLENRCGMVLAGHSRFAKYFSKMSDKDAFGFRELKRRISYWLPLRAGVEASFIKVVCAEHNIVSPSGVKYIAENCMNYGDVEVLIRSFNKYRETKTVDSDEERIVMEALKFNKLAN